MMLSSRALPGKRWRAMAVAAANPKMALQGTAIAVAIKVSRRAERSSGDLKLSRKTPNPLAKACTTTARAGTRITTPTYRQARIGIRAGRK